MKGSKVEEAAALLNVYKDIDIARRTRFPPSHRPIHAEVGCSMPGGDRQDFLASLAEHLHRGGFTVTSRKRHRRSLSHRRGLDSHHHCQPIDSSLLASETTGRSEIVSVIIRAPEFNFLGRFKRNLGRRLYRLILQGLEALQVRFRTVSKALQPQVLLDSRLEFSNPELTAARLSTMLRLARKHSHKGMPGNENPPSKAQARYLTSPCRLVRRGTPNT